MIAWTLLMVFLVLSKASASPVSNHSLSPNTRTFVMKYLNKGLVDIPNIRAGRSTISSFIPTKSSDEDDRVSLRHLRTKLVKAILFKKNDVVSSVLTALYKLYPEYNHIDHIYQNSKSKASGTLLHFAVMTCNLDFFDIAYDFRAATDIENENGYTPLELAFIEGHKEMISALVTNFPLCCDEQFLEYPSVIHYAAARNDLNLLTCVAESQGFVHFSFSAEGTLEYPLEIALNNSNLLVAEYLMKNKFFCPKERIESIYLQCIDTFSKKKHVAIHILEFYGEFMYMTNSNGLDIMLLAIKNGNEIYIRNLFYLGYDKKQASYSLEQKMVELAASDVIIELFKYHK